MVSNLLMLEGMQETIQTIIKQNEKQKTTPIEKTGGNKKHRKRYNIIAKQLIYKM